MKKQRYYIIFLFFALSAALISCSSAGGARKGCGCGAHKGYVGY